MESLQQHIDRVRDYFDKHVLRDAGVMKASAEAVLKAAESALSPTPAQVGDVITVECVVVRHPQVVTDMVEVHGYQGQSASQTMLDVQDENNDYVLQISTIKVDVPKSLLQPVELPPVTATPA